MPAKAKSAREATPVAENIWAFLGTDDLKLKEAALQKCREVTPPDAGDFGVDIIDGQADNAEHAVKIIRSTYEAIQTIPFFGGEKVVWLKSANFLADTVAGRSASVLGALEDLQKLMATDMPQNVRLIISATDVDKRRSFFLWLKKAVQCEVHDLISTGSPGWEEAVERLVRDRSSHFQVKFQQDALELFVLLAGENTRQIDNELEKLSLYIGEPRPATVEDVRAIVAQTKGAVVFELGTAIGQRRLPLALALVDQLIAEQEAAIAILLAAIVPKVRNLFMARELVERHRLKISTYPSFQSALEKLPAEAIASLPKKKDGGLNVYPLFLAAKEAANFTAAELQRGLEECLRANRRIVTTGLDHVIVLNQLLFRLIAGKERAA